jgi:hypothetical protein
MLQDLLYMLVLEEAEDIALWQMDMTIMIYFHFNWGWGGNADGYFNINALNPGALGTGGGSGGFNSGHQAVIGIEPPSSGGGGSADLDMRLYSTLNFSSSPITYSSDFSLSVDLANYGIE